MHKTFFILFAFFGLAGLVAEAHAQIDYKIVIGPERGTYIQIGQDLVEDSG
ncbi:MAG: Immunogenic protein [uncultured Caballeronia sp.]|nr:MAG: Immunogenic protein [uncultured Caballeronia sp.]